MPHSHRPTLFAAAAAVEHTILSAHPFPPCSLLRHARRLSTPGRRAGLGSPPSRPVPPRPAPPRQALALLLLSGDGKRVDGDGGGDGGSGGDGDEAAAGSSVRLAVVFNPSPGEGEGDPDGDDGGAEAGAKLELAGRWLPAVFEAVGSRAPDKV